MKKITIVILFFTLPFVLLAGKDGDSSKVNMEELQRYITLMDSVNKALKFQTGNIQLENGVAQLNVPAGFKFLNKEQSNYVVTELWGNPPQSGILGMLFPENGGPFADSSYAFVITYDAMGYVKDDDADKINYDDMLKQLQEGEKEENAERIKQGYTSVHMVGWAQKPFYDKTNKVLHWAKEIKFGTDSEQNTLNYEVRILGRKGVLSLNAVATMSELSAVKKDIDKVLAIPSFTKGNTYGEFDSKVDDVAAWTIGGLVAGKVLAKAGFLALLLKNIKLVAIGVIAAGGAVWRFITGRRKKEEEWEPTNTPPADTNS
jgi:uncharacterized membrane-anchored protein